MELSQLETFLAVLEAGSLSRAAANLHLTQPAVTKQIHALEKELRTVLLERGGRGVTPTASGLVLQDYARRSLALLREGRDTIDALSTGVTGELILGAGVTTSILRLPAWLSTLRAELPNVDVTVRTGTSSEVQRLALDREIDLGLVTSIPRQPQLEIVPLLREEIILVAAPELEIPTQLDQVPLILFRRGTGFRDYLDARLAAAGLGFTVKMESDSLEAIKSFVAVGLGASFLPVAAVSAELRETTLRRVVLPGLPHLERQTAAIFRRDRHLNPAARAFLRIAHQS